MRKVLPDQVRRLPAPGYGRSRAPRRVHLRQGQRVAAAGERRPHTVTQVTQAHYDRQFGEVMGYTISASGMIGSRLGWCLLLLGGFDRRRAAEQVKAVGDHNDLGSAKACPSCSAVLTRIGLRVWFVCLAAAHAERVAANPAPGSLLASSPCLIRLEISEALGPGSGVVIYGSGFRRVLGVESVVDLPEPTRLVATVPELTPDNYTVQWTSLSVDGDILSGSYAFGVQPPTERPILVVASLSAGLIGLALLAAIVARRRRGSRVTTPALELQPDTLEE